MNISLRPVRKTDCPFLYETLLERDKRVNISHTKMPTYNQHVKFVMSKPYSKWYIINFNNKKIGTIYLSNQDEIGIYIKNTNQGGGIGQKALKLLMQKNPRKRYLANVNPKNSKSIKFFKKNKFKILQHTYELNPKKR